SHSSTSPTPSLASFPTRRSSDLRKCVDPAAQPDDFRRPGHVFPLVARRGGVLTRPGHTEATVDLMRHAGLPACGLCCEIMRDDRSEEHTSELQSRFDLVCRLLLE